MSVCLYSCLSYPARKSLFCAVVYSSTLFHKSHDFRGEKVEHKSCFDSLYNFCLQHFTF
jgi:hypothetical protein